MSNIDWDFIGVKEGKRVLNGYVPKTKNMKSGVTIATGFDLGQRNLSDLAGLPKDIIDILTPYLGIKGASAEELASNLKVSDSQAKTIDEFSHGEVLNDLRTKWKAATGGSFDDLPMNKATVIASVRFQHGDLERKTPNFWRQVTNDDWVGAVKNLRNFGDEFPTRRNSEADYYLSNIDAETQKKRLDETLAVTAPADAPSRQLTNEELIAKAQGQISAAKGEPEVPTTVEPETKSPYDKIEVPDWFMKDKPTVEYPIRPEPDIVPQVSQQPSMVPEEKYDPAAKPMDPMEMIRRDINEAGPIAKTLSKNEFKGANPLYFNENSGQIWSAAFNQLNPIKALSDYVNDLMVDHVDEDGYDSAADPRVKENPELLWRAINSESFGETTSIIERLEEERLNQDILSSSDSAVAELTASIVTPSTGAPVSAMKYMTTASKAKRFVGGAAFSLATVLPEQMVLQAAREDRTLVDSAMALSLVSLAGGTLNTAFGPTMAKAKIARRVKKDAAWEAKQTDGVYESLGAAADPSRARQTAYATMERDAAKETGVKLEKLGWNPVFRMLKSSNPIVRGLAAEMVDMGGVATKRIDEELPMAQSVETTFRSRYLSELLEAMRKSDEAYLSYRGKVASDSDIVRSFQILGTQISDKFKSGGDYLSEVDFRIRIGKAMRRGDVDEVGDAASPYVSQAAAAARRQLNMIKKEAEDVRLFEAEIQKALEIARRSGDSAEVSRLTEHLNNVRSQGVSVNTAASYLPRIYRIDRIMDDPQRFVSIVRAWAIENKGMSRQAAQKYADEVMDSVTRSRPYIGLEGDDLDQLLSPASTKMRTFEIPDELIEEFLESDIEVLLRHHTRTMGMDIEIARRFGSIDMKSVIDDVTNEYTRLIDEATDIQIKNNLRESLANDLRDIRGLRDRLRGTYGASKDPHAMSSRFVRSMKSFNVLVGMGGAMVSSIPDIARIVMVEGIENAYGKGLKIQFARQARTINRLSESELRKSAVAADAVLGLRAHAFADLGDVFGNRFAVERVLSASTGVMFVLNGLNIWNQALKEFAGNVTMLRMTEAIMKPWNSLSRADKEKLLKNGIGQQEHMRMSQQIRNHGEQIDGEWMPNTEAWTDPTMRLSFRNALNQNVERIIITPGAGDRALWTSTEFGSMLTQFKSFGQAATVRMLTSGLQERDGAFWQGAFLLVGLGALTNELKRKQYGLDDRKETFDEKLINAIDRSGITGYFMDVNNAVEKLSNNRLGLRPAALDKTKKYVPNGAKLNAVLGPTAANISNAASIMTDVITGEADQKTADSLRFLTPFGNHPVADPFFDWAYGQ